MQLDKKISTFARRFSLTKREEAVLCNLIFGKDKLEYIRRDLGISFGTAAATLNQLTCKVGARTTAQVLSKFIRYHREN